MASSLYSGVKKRKLGKLSESLSNRTTKASAARVLSKIAGLQGKKTTDADFGKQGVKGLSEVKGEVGQKHRLKRAKELAPSLAGRTTASSLQRATNRVAANFGLTTGATGTTVQTKRRKKAA